MMTLYFFAVKVITQKTVTEQTHNQSQIYTISFKMCNFKLTSYKSNWSYMMTHPFNLKMFDSSCYGFFVCATFRRIIILREKLKTIDCQIV